MTDDTSSTPTTPATPEPAAAPPISRRRFLAGGLTLAAGGAGALLWHGRSRAEAEVFVTKATSYEKDFSKALEEGLTTLGHGASWVKGKTVLLKPNLVEPAADVPHINTHPLFVRQVAEAFLRLGAARVIVAEGQGHVRDSDLVLDLSGLRAVLDEKKLRFADLNHDAVTAVTNPLRRSRLDGYYLPNTLLSADIIVSLPKMKTHHWAGVTLSMKNLFGTLPSMCYGWPKNPLHLAGIPESIVDIAATVKPHLAIVDGIIGMEGDGPIMGTAKSAGLIVMGTNLTAVDATCCRLMGLDPKRLPFLQLAGPLGPIEESAIQQRGEPLAGLVTPFSLLENWKHLRAI